jgi:predicted phosphoribosyltransferase
MAYHETSLFQNRIEAGELLAEKLARYKNDPGIVLAVPRGGVPVAYPIALKWGFPMELILTKKISHPGHKEYAIGAASLTDYFIHPQHKVSEEYIQQELTRIRARLKEMQKIFLQADTPADLRGKTVIIVDDGIATGHTIAATIQLLRQQHPQKIIVAVPVAPSASVRQLAKEVDEVITLQTPHDFYGVGAYYKDFTQVSDAEVLHYLDLLKTMRKAG